jgi:hypothetical protein
VSCNEIVPAAQEDAPVALAADRHAHDVAEEGEAFLGLRRQQFHMAEMGDVHHGLFGRHGVSSAPAVI